MEHLVDLETLASTTSTMLDQEYQQIELVKSRSKFYHYLCDGQDDRRWGCGYRTLQAMCSWIAMKKKQMQSDFKPLAVSNSLVPNISEIQTCLVDVGDKSKSFLSSKEWIGCYEACIVLDHLYGVSSKIVHVPKGAGMSEQGPVLLQHFKDVGSPVMIGGDEDGASKTLIGIGFISNDHDVQFLIADPHYCGPEDHKEIVDGGHVRWFSNDIFDTNSFYNMCLPQFP